MSRETRGYPKLFAEPQRRRAFKLASIYDATAFAVLQLAHSIFPSPSVPPCSITLIVGPFAKALLPSSSEAVMVLSWASRLSEQ